jgi:hypothetical protein
MNIEIESYDERAKEFLRKIILLKQKEAEKVQTAQIKARCANCIHLEKVDFTRYRCPKNEILPPPKPSLLGSLKDVTSIDPKIPPKPMFNLLKNIVFI